MTSNKCKMESNTYNEFWPEYRYNEFWPKFSIMMNDVSNKYGLEIDDDFRHFTNADNWYVKFNEDYDPADISKVVVYFEIIKTGKTQRETNKFEYLCVEGDLEENTVYYLNEDIDTFMERLQNELEKTIDDFIVL